MLEVELEKYDLIIATPPCNYYSKANYRRETSEYSQKTKHLLPKILKKLEESGKIYIVENVINKVLMKDIIKNMKGWYHEIGRHSYFTSEMLNMDHVKQIKEDVENTTQNKRQGGENVNNVIKYYIEYIKKGEKNE